MAKEILMVLNGGSIRDEDEIHLMDAVVWCGVDFCFVG
jgi:hypothetical protein